MFNYCRLVFECGIKEFGSVLRHTWYRGAFWFNPHIHGLNPKSIPKGSTVAKVVLLLHGAGSHPGSFIPLAQHLAANKIGHVYTIPLQQTSKDPVPTEPIVKRVNELAKGYLEAGYTGVTFSFVGHSLGALAATKYTWRNKPSNITVDKVISVAGRLLYKECRFSFFCQDVRPEIDETYKAICKDPNRAHLFTISSQQDAIVPEASVHIGRDLRKQLRVTSWGHGGILFSPEVQKRIAEWLS